MLFEYHRADELAVFAGYWNAFECLVEAVETLSPYPRPTRDEKKQAIDVRLKKAGTDVDSGDIEYLYREVVDPGLRRKAEHAIRQCAGEKADDLIGHCFEYDPANQGLYAIRNCINHGTVDVDDPETVMMIGSRFRHLFVLVFTMLRGVLSLSLSAHG